MRPQRQRFEASCMKHEARTCCQRGPSYEQRRSQYDGIQAARFMAYTEKVSHYNVPSSDAQVLSSMCELKAVNLPTKLADVADTPTQAMQLCTAQQCNVGVLHTWYHTCTPLDAVKGLLYARKRQTKFCARCNPMPVTRTPVSCLGVNVVLPL
jgi:hypothetical protein